MVSMKFLTNEPALLLGRGRGKVLVIADLHIGIEHEFWKSGIRIPSQIDRMRERIERLLRLTKPQRLIILGDLKHKVPGLSWQELREVPEFLNSINKMVRLEVAPGNHDPGLKGLVPDIKIHPSSGLLLGDYYLLHGHTWPSQEFLGAKQVIIGHNHPVIEFRDRLGYVWREPVWIRTGMDRKKILAKFGKLPGGLPGLVIMPVFNEFAGGIALNPRNRKKGKFMGPLGKCAEMKVAGTYLLDGTFLGELNKL